MAVGNPSSDDEFPDLELVLREISSHKTQSGGMNTRDKNTKAFARGGSVAPLPSTEVLLAEDGRREAKVGTGGAQNTTYQARPLIRRRKLNTSENFENTLLKPFRQENTNIGKDVTKGGCDRLRVRRRDVATKEATTFTVAEVETTKNEIAKDQITKSTDNRSIGRSSKTNVSERLDYDDDAWGGALREQHIVTRPPRSIVDRYPAQKANDSQRNNPARPTSRDDTLRLCGLNATSNDSKTHRPNKQPENRIPSTDQATEVSSTSPLQPTGQRKECSEQQHEEPGILPPSTPQNLSGSRPRTLVSPEKLPVPPKTPHGPSVDLFWDREFVDEWNAEHSPKKLFLPAVRPSPTKSKAKKKEARISFEQRRQEIAATFLKELDEVITQGRLAELASSTGGVAIRWSNKLNTTAGRAHWKKETVRTVGSDGHEPATAVRDHASIELSEKVIDDEHRLLNVVAHEFCHLANFMVTGITANPHGKEFKAWAAKVSRAFHDRGIEVTTKHSYDIDFRYIWECTDCGTEYKRHSKSIHPERQRCGACKGALKQTKPAPRAVTGKKSDYQLFVQEQMGIVRKDNPHTPQKDLMRLIAQKWAQKAERTSRNTMSSEQSGLVEAVADELRNLSI